MPDLKQLRERQWIEDEDDIYCCDDAYILLDTIDHNTIRLQCKVCRFVRIVKIGKKMEGT